MQEEWKDIIGYEGYYQISNMGRVKSLFRKVIMKNGRFKTIKESIIVQKLTGPGYLQVAFSRNNIKIYRDVHRLVALYFISNELNLPQVNHKDEDKKNNVYTNLEWMTAKQNVNHGTGIQRGAAAISKPVRQLSVSGELIKIWPSAMVAEREGGYDQCCIWERCNGIKKLHRGYKWEYLNETI